MYSRPIGVASHFNGVRSRKTAVEQAPAAKDVGDVSRSLLYLGPVPFLRRRTSINTSPSRIHSTVSSTITNCSFPIYCFSSNFAACQRGGLATPFSALALLVPATVPASYHVSLENCPRSVSSSSTFTTDSCGEFAVLIASNSTPNHAKVTVSAISIDLACSLGVLAFRSSKQGLFSKKNVQELEYLWFS